MSLRLVVPTTMIQEVLHNCHDSIEGGHQVKHDYYWIGLYADVEKHVKLCLDCSSSKSLPQLKGYSPGNELAERPFQVVSMDFVIFYRDLVEGTLPYCYGSDRLRGL
ncbi:reverse transcriptase [Phytophthora megakarya]|uniref:Reverse transcriptase n=1 Tax=Phytophthora megakarya TaxID=4795 RepID=A0A225VP19_9STRA|nr:reverse transcriptase [Phytophthora megakarya]